MKIIYLSEYYITSDSSGASNAIRNLYRAFQEKHDIEIICRYLLGDNMEDIPVKVLSPEVFPDYLKENRIDLIHHFKATGRSYFRHVCSCLNRSGCNIPIITTICQRPSFEGLELTPGEIKNSNILVFIDKAASCDSHYQFIPKSRKRFLYFGYTERKLKLLDEIKTQISKNHNCNVVYGRGSSLNKCHKHMIDVYDNIDINNKKFIFVGGSKLPEWLEARINGRSDIQWLKSMPYNQWLKECATFDVFLYVLPESSYSSIDGTLGDAMLLGIPPVVYGPDAIKERIVHGESGYIASTLEEAVDFCTKLGADEKLRIKIGEEARKRILEKFPLSKTVSEYDILYKEVIGTWTKDIKLPIPFYIFYYTRLIKLVPKYLRKKIHG